MSRRELAVGAVVAALLVLAPARAEACVDVGCITDGLAGLVLIAPVVVVGVIGLGADLSYSVEALNDAGNGRRPSATAARHELYWTSWQSAAYLGISTGMALGGGDDAVSNAAPLFAFSTWPLALTAHGTWYAAQGAPVARYGVAGVFAAAELTLASYDTIALVRGGPVPKLYSFFEMASGALETAYAVDWATNQLGIERTRTLALGALPALLTVHGLTALVAGSRERPSAPPAKASGLQWTPYVVSRAGGVECIWAGRF